MTSYRAAAELGASVGLVQEFLRAREERGHVAVRNLGGGGCASRSAGGRGGPSTGVGGAEEGADSRDPGSATAAGGRRAATVVRLLAAEECADAAALEHV